MACINVLMTKENIQWRQSKIAMWGPIDKGKPVRSLCFSRQSPRTDNKVSTPTQYKQLS